MLAIILAYMTVLIGVAIAARFANGVLGFSILYPPTVVAATGLNGTVLGYAADLRGGNVKDTFVSAAATGLGVALVFFPLNFWLKRRKATKKT
ncbi:MAG: hypothetical protein WAS26_02070 [Paracoccaceae bacterium]|jgi:hypothetical protein